MPENKIGCLGIILKALGLLPDDVDGSLPYGVRDDFLSSSELSFYRVLQQAINDETVIFTKVSLSDIFFVKRPGKNTAYHNKIARKHVDFLLCSTDTLKPVAGIELDDISHERADRVERDRFVNDVFETAGLPLIRFKNKNSYAINEIKEKIEAAINKKETYISEKTTADEVIAAGQSDVPLCPHCGVPMVLRVASKGQHKGEKFYGCPNYPRCKETIEIEDK